MSNFKQTANDGQFQSLLDTVERLRKQHFAHLDSNLVREVLSLHADAAAADAELARTVERAVERHVTEGS